MSSKHVCHMYIWLPYKVKSCPLYTKISQHATHVSRLRPARLNTWMHIHAHQHWHMLSNPKVWRRTFKGYLMNHAHDSSYYLEDRFLQKTDTHTHKHTCTKEESVTSIQKKKKKQDLGKFFSLHLLSPYFYHQCAHPSYSHSVCLCRPVFSHSLRLTRLRVCKLGALVADFAWQY